MLVVDRASGEISHRNFRDFPEFAGEEDLLVLNNTRVVPARFYSNDGRVELLQVDKLSPTRWVCMENPESG